MRMTRRRTLRRKNNVIVQYAIPRSGVPAPATLRRWARAAASGFGLTVRIVGSREARALNRRYRRRDYATNVLSFPYGESGDVVLCHPMIRREAREQGKSVRAHYAHLVVHGALHVRGHAHDDNASAKRMEAMEIRILRRLGFGNPYTVESGRTA